MRADRFQKIRSARLFFVCCGLVFLGLPARAIPETPPSIGPLLQQAREQKLAETRYWHLLLHYHHDLLGRYRSEIDDPVFFLSPKGRKDPAAELEATLEAFFQPVLLSSTSQPAQCRYPARYAWLKEQLRFDDRLDQPCARFEKWRSEMNPDSLTIIFASYYLNNPASMYGHTLLRLNNKNHGDRERLLDYVVNFAAYPDTTNGLLFAIEGLTGGYRGRFSTTPYYLKVQEYNNLESRDLWEYSLNLDPKGIDRLVQHLWELGPASMAYFFLNKNCSYQLLPLLEIAEPSLRLTNRFWFKAIPVDTLRSVIQAGDGKPSPLLAKARLRPSHVSKMLAARAQLSGEELRVTELLAHSARAGELEALRAFPLNRQLKILDSAYDLFRYRAGFTRDQPPKNLEQERSLLMARHQAGLKEPPADAALPPKEESAPLELSPDRGHRTGRAGVSFGSTKRSNFEEISLRSALHDQDDNPGGYIPGSQLEMFHLRLRYDNDRRATYLQEFTLINLLSLSPWDRWVRKPSWNVHTGAAVADDLNRDGEHALYYGLHTGPGISFKTRAWRGELWYALAQADAALGHVFDDGYRLGGGVDSGVLVEAAPWWRIHFSAGYLRYPVGEVGEAVKLRLIQSVPLGRRAQLRITLERQNAYKEMLFSVLWYL